jgi:hypothetical protein
MISGIAENSLHAAAWGEGGPAFGPGAAFTLADEHRCAILRIVTGEGQRELSPAYPAGEPRAGLVLAVALFESQYIG